VEQGIVGWILGTNYTDLHSALLGGLLFSVIDSVCLFVCLCMCVLLFCCLIELGNLEHDELMIHHSGIYQMLLFRFLIYPNSSKLPLKWGLEQRFSVK